MLRAAIRFVALVFVVPLVVGFAPATARDLEIGSTGFLVSASWLAQLGGDSNIIVVDTRPADTYSQGHIPGAVSVPWTNLAQPSSDEAAVAAWEARTSELLGGAGISPSNIVVSYDDSGNQFAARMRWLLKYFGHEKAVVLDGGLPAWTKLGRPLSDEPVTRPATTYVATPNPDRLATWQYVFERLGNPEVEILDVRPSATYTGADPGTFAHAGHIPGALNVDWNNNVEAESPRTFKSFAELQATYDAIGLDRNKEIIVYCVSGVASANTLLVLDMLGYPNVRLYSASWAEWGNRDDLPFATGTDAGGPVN